MANRSRRGLPGRERAKPRAGATLPRRFRLLALGTMLLYLPAANHGVLAVVDALFPAFKDGAAGHPCAGHGCLCATLRDCLRGCCCAPGAARAARGGRPAAAGEKRVRLSFVQALECAGDPGAGGARAGARSLAPHIELPPIGGSLRLPPVARRLPEEPRWPRAAAVEPPEDVPRISV